MYRSEIIVMKYAEFSLFVCIMIGALHNNIDAQEVIDDYFNRGYVYAEKGFIAEGIQEFNTVLSLKPTDEMAVRSHFNLGILYTRISQPENAVRHFEEACALNPNQFLLHWHLANLYKNIGDYEKTLFNFKRALELDPDYRDVYTLYYNIGYAYIKLDKNKEAIEPLTKALEYQPQHDGILSLLAQAYFNLAQYDHTEAYLNRLENLGYPQRDFFEKLNKARAGNR